MSRIGKKPIALGDKVKAKVTGDVIHIESAKGKLAYPIPRGITVSVENSTILITRSDDSRPQKASHGLLRALVANAVKGLEQGFTKELEIEGIGYKAQVQGRTVIFNLGYTNPVVFPIPDGIDIKIDKQTKISISGYDRQKVGQVAADIRAMRIPDVYKGKGIKYAGEILRKKVGKTGA